MDAPQPATRRDTRKADQVGQCGNRLQTDVVLANAQYYHEIAHKYDRYEVCVQDRRLQAKLQDDLATIAKLVTPKVKPVHCLDCGGGSGNLSLKMLQLGWDVTVLDVSPDMLALLERRAQSSGFTPKLINSSIEEFFAKSWEEFDVITFSSVLHHLYSYISVVEQATARIRQGGCFYSTFDPVISERGPLRVVIEAVDTACAKALHDPSDFFPGIARRVKKIFQRPDGSHHRAVVSAGDVAEYHAKQGVEEEEIIRVLTSKDFSLVAHRQWPTARTWPMRFVNDHVQLIKSFSILAHRSVPVPSMPDAQM